MMYLDLLLTMNKYNISPKKTEKKRTETFRSGKSPGKLNSIKTQQVIAYEE